jgi:xanthine dehydrogenase small subunit
MVAYFRPATLDEALALRAGRDLRVLAGGTDVYPMRVTREAWGDTAHQDVLDITAIPGLRGISTDDTHHRIGCLTTWTDLIEAPLPPAFDGLKRAAREVGGVQIQNRGTIVGNICNASPAADGTPCLLTLDAGVEIASAGATRAVALADFFDGYRSTICRPGEIVTAILVPRLPEAASSHFLKLGARHYLVISIVMVAGVIVPDASGRIADARIAVGSCSVTARRLRALEADLKGRALDARLADVVADAHFADLAPIDDIRATAGYRRQAATSLVRDLLRGFAGAVEGRAA